MKHYLFSNRIGKALVLPLLVFAMSSTLLGQSVEQKKMAELSFLVGQWVGNSKSFDNGQLIREIPAFEHIKYALDGHILTIDLQSESLVLHTIIYYDAEQQTYFYNPYRKTGNGRYPAYLKDGQLVVQPNASKRFIFKITENGDFQEYGELLKDGKWEVYFEDTFKKTN